LNEYAGSKLEINRDWAMDKKVKLKEKAAGWWSALLHI
jgi:hypothetical protein